MLTFETGMKLLISKKFAEIYECSIGALKKNKKNPLAFFFLGMLATEAGNPEKTLELFAKASEHEPTNARYQAHYAKALLHLGHVGPAKAYADIAAGLRIKDAFVADMIGTVYSRIGYHELAFPLFILATTLNSGWALFHFNLGASAQFIGDFDKARSAYTQAISLNPKFYQAWFALISLEKQKLGNNHIKTLKSLFRNTTHEIEAQLLLGHAIAKILEDIEQYQESFEWLIKAKCGKKQQVQYNRKKTAEVFEVARTSLMPPPIPITTNPDNSPIFVVGLPRTGTTLVDRILSSHKEVFSAGEVNLLDSLIKTKAAATFQSPISGKIPPTSHTLNFQEIGNTYRKHIQSLVGTFPYVVDKTPLNFFHAGFICQAFPNARIITLRRGAMDSCLSNFRHLFASQNTDYDYTYDLQDTAEYYREYDSLMGHFRKTLPTDRFMEIQYEDIVHDQENQTRRLLTFCGLDWDVSCLRFHENSAPVDTASSVQVREPLHTGAIGRWKKYGPKLDVLKTTLGALVADS